MIIFIMICWYVIGVWSGIQIIREEQDIKINDLYFLAIMGFLGPINFITDWVYNHSNDVLIKRK